MALRFQKFCSFFVTGESQCNTFRVPGMPGRYEVRLLDGNDTLATSEVEVLGNNLITFVQTDKPIYKPGDKGERTGQSAKLFACSDLDSRQTDR